MHLHREIISHRSKRRKRRVPMVHARPFSSLPSTLRSTVHPPQLLLRRTGRFPGLSSDFYLPCIPSIPRFRIAAFCRMASPPSAPPKKNSTSSNQTKVNQGNQRQSKVINANQSHKPHHAPPPTNHPAPCNICVSSDFRFQHFRFQHFEIVSDFGFSEPHSFGPVSVTACSPRR